MLCCVVLVDLLEFRVCFCSSFSSFSSFIVHFIQLLYGTGFDHGLIKRQQIRNVLCVSNIEIHHGNMDSIASEKVIFLANLTSSPLVLMWD